MKPFRHPGAIKGRPVFRCLAALFAVLSLSACQVNPERDVAELEPPELQPAPEPPQPVRLVDALDALQDGRFDVAADQLDELLRSSPGSSTLSLLRRQLAEPPSELLPGPYRSLRVEAGDTLSAIAEQELGNPLLFVALARLNGLERPRSLAVGAELRVPLEPRGEPVSDLAPGNALAGADPESVSSVEDADTTPIPRRNELVTVADYLLATGQPTDARELLMAAGREGGLASDAEDLLVELSLDSARGQAEAGQFAQAVATLTEAAAVLPTGSARARLEVRRMRIEVLQQLDRADVFEQRGRLGEAHNAALSALAIDPDFIRSVETEQRLREALVADYHERALRAWRGRDIDLAIRTWRELLDHAPDFEPAKVYLARATELRQRLDDDGDF